MERNNKKYDDITSPIYNTLHREYESILERGRSIDSRAGIFLTFLFTAFPFYIQILDLNYVKQILERSCFNFAEEILIITFCLSLISFLVAFVLFVIVLSSRKYKAFNDLLFKDFNIIEYENRDTTVNDINVGLMGFLHEYIEYNNKVITKKAKIFDAALWVCFSYVALMVITILLKLI